MAFAEHHHKNTTFFPLAFFFQVNKKKSWHETKGDEKHKQKNEYCGALKSRVESKFPGKNMKQNRYFVLSQSSKPSDIRSAAQHQRGLVTGPPAMHAST